jgi:hypothetical protein
MKLFTIIALVALMTVAVVASSNAESVVTYSHPSYNHCSSLNRHVTHCSWLIHIFCDCLFIYLFIYFLGLEKHS